MSHQFNMHQGSTAEGYRAALNISCIGRYMSRTLIQHITIISKHLLVNMGRSHIL